MKTYFWILVITINTTVYSSDFYDQCPLEQTLYFELDDNFDNITNQLIEICKTTILKSFEKFILEEENFLDLVIDEFIGESIGEPVESINMAEKLDYSAGKSMMENYLDHISISWIMERLQTVPDNLNVSILFTILIVILFIFVFLIFFWQSRKRKRFCNVKTFTNPSTGCNYELQSEPIFANGEQIIRFQHRCSKCK